MGANQSTAVGAIDEKAVARLSSAEAEAADVQRVVKDTSWIWVNERFTSDPMHAHAGSNYAAADVSKERKPEALSLSAAEEWQTSLLKDPKARSDSLLTLPVVETAWLNMLLSPD
jgi:hypothetical protein